MENNEDTEMCPNCGLRMVDPEVCDFCDYKRRDNRDKEDGDECDNQIS